MVTYHDALFPYPGPLPEGGGGNETAVIHSKIAIPVSPLLMAPGLFARHLRFVLLPVLFLLCLTAQAAPQFPTLTGRVVDVAGVLSQETEQALAD